MTLAALQRVERTIDLITLSPRNAKTSIASAEKGRVLCEPKRSGVVIMPFGPTRTDVVPVQTRGRACLNTVPVPTQ